ncbi:hypothetical protein [Paenibacillus humicola]|uniref:hypothetical protein n=1 Tax=Paenibacillus humicola TaxID=3110540 RepID=UPI00237AAB2D|nr:hypothetical protein [Paenibacillus humicola]
MVKCYYLFKNQPEKEYYEDHSLLVMTGFKKSELVVRDDGRVITPAEYLAYSMSTYLPESDSHTLKYIIHDKGLARKFLTEKKCKLLCDDRSVHNGNAIDYLLKDF